jgi:hypothetical protein
MCCACLGPAGSGRGRSPDAAAAALLQAGQGQEQGAGARGTLPPFFYCFELGSAWIRSGLAPLDPNPHWQYGFRSQGDADPPPASSKRRLGY